MYTFMWFPLKAVLVCPYWTCKTEPFVKDVSMSYAFWILIKGVSEFMGSTRRRPAFVNMYFINFVRFLCTNIYVALHEDMHTSPAYFIKQIPLVRYIHNEIIQITRMNLKYLCCYAYYANCLWFYLDVTLTPC